MGQDDRADKHDPFPPLLKNPLVPRQPLREILEPLSEDLFEGPVGKKIGDAIHALVTRADQHTKDQEEFSAAVFRGFERSDGVMRGLHSTLQEIKVVLNMSPPPMRPETPSSLDLKEHSRKSFGEYLKEKAREAPGGPGKVQATPEELEQAANGFFEERMAVYLQRKRTEELEAAEARRHAEALEKAERDKRLAEDAVKQRRNLWVLTVSGAIVALVGVVGTYVATRAANERDKAVAHEQGLAEGYKAAPSVVVTPETLGLVLPPPPDAASATAPAAAAPPRRAK